MNEQIRQYIYAHKPVFIDHNNDNGAWVFAVALCEMPDFWLDAFDTKREAIAFCRKNELPIRETPTPR